MENGKKKDECQIISHIKDFKDNPLNSRPRGRGRNIGKEPIQ